MEYLMELFNISFFKICFHWCSLQQSSEKYQRCNYPVSLGNAATINTYTIIFALPKEPGYVPPLLSLLIKIRLVYKKHSKLKHSRWVSQKSFTKGSVVDFWRNVFVTKFVLIFLICYYIFFFYFLTPSYIITSWMNLI
jgi:hypothetical protein